MSLYRAKFAAEQALRASGLRWTIIRPSAYLETWIGVTGAKLAGKGQALVFGPGRNPVNFVAAEDVAVADDPAIRDRLPTVPATTLHDLLTRQPSPQVPPADARPPR